MIYPPQWVLKRNPPATPRHPKTWGASSNLGRPVHVIAQWYPPVPATHKVIPCFFITGTGFGWLISFDFPLKTTKKGYQLEQRHSILLLPICSPKGACCRTLHSSARLAPGSERLLKGNGQVLYPQAFCPRTSLKEKHAAFEQNHGRLAEGTEYPYLFVETT